MRTETNVAVRRALPGIGAWWIALALLAATGAAYAPLLFRVLDDAAGARGRSEFVAHARRPSR